MATYYISNTGNDITGDGSISTPWQTISKVNSLSLSPGDSVLFNKGDVWRETLEVPDSGTTENHITFGSYGTGTNPQILGSKATTTWTDQGSNVWKSDVTFVNPNGVSGYNADIHFNESGTITWGDFKANTGSLAVKYDWTWSANYIYIYSTFDPSGVYTSIEVPQRFTCIDTYHNEYLHFNSIDVFYGVYVGYDDYSSHDDHIDISGLIIEDCEVAYIGGISNTQAGFGIATPYSDLVIQNCTIHDCGRRGISLDIYGDGFTAVNAIIENCTFYGGFHTTALDLSVGSGYTGGWNGVYFRNNIVSDTSIAPYTIQSNQIFLQDWTPGTGAVATNIYIYNNIFKYPNGAGVVMEGMDQVYVYNNTFYSGSVLAPYTIQLWIDANNTNIEVKNNIFYGGTSELYGWPVYCSSTYSNVDLDYNLYYRSNSSWRIVSYSGTTYDMTDQASLISNYGWETNGVFTDPIFTSSSDYHLQEDSPAIGEGFYLSGVVDTDYENIVRSNPPSIGAYEYDVIPLSISAYINKIGII